MTEIYMRDLKKEMQTDEYLGKGTEDLIKQAEKEEKDIIVGEFCKPRMEE